MKKILAITFCIILIFSISTSFATEQINENNTQQEEKTEQIEEEEKVEIDNYEDFESLNQFGYTQQELGKYYEEQQNTYIDYYENYERDSIGDKAKVISIDEEDATVVNKNKGIYSYYYLDSNYGNISLIQYQALTVKFLEGENEGKEAKLYHYLPVDSLGNVKAAPLKIGDVVYATATVVGDTLGAEIVSIDSYVSRTTWLIIIAVIIISLVIIYGGKHGIQNVLMLALILDLIILVFIPCVIKGISPILIGITIGTVLIITNTITKLGLKKEAIFTAIISLVIMLITTAALFGICTVTNMTGITLEVSLIADNVLLQNINFYHLFVSILTIISSIVISNLVSDITKTCEEAGSEANINTKLNLCKKIFADKIPTVTIIFIGLITYKFLLLALYKYSIVEYINSEIIHAELARLFSLILGMAITVPVTVILEDMFMKNTRKE